MAIITIAAPLSGIRGKVGGLVYSANGSGTYVKGWSRPTNTRTFPQTLQRTRMTRFTADWQGLTQVQRDAWDTYAALPAQEKTNSLGEAYFISGFNWFVSLNTRLLASEEPTISTAPVSANPTLPGSVSFEFHLFGPTLLISAFMLTADITFDNAVLFVSTTSLQSRTIAPSTQFYMLPIPAIVSLTTFFAIEVPYVAKFGTPTTNWRIWFTLFAQDTDGQRSAPLTAVRNFGDTA